MGRNECPERNPRNARLVLVQVQGGCGARLCFYGFDDNIRRPMGRARNSGGACCCLSALGFACRRSRRGRPPPCACLDRQTTAVLNPCVQNLSRTKWLRGDGKKAVCAMAHLFPYDDPEQELA